jgi:hypothetical protein
MSVEIPQPFKTKVVSPITVDGIPDTFHIDVQHIPTISLTVENLPTIHLSVDHIPKIQLGVEPVEIRLTEFPSIRGHLPADFCVGFSILGLELLNVRLCGEAQIITEPYQPNPCEAGVAGRLETSAQEARPVAEDAAPSPRTPRTRRED